MTSPGKINLSRIKGPPLPSPKTRAIRLAKKPVKVDENRKVTHPLVNMRKKIIKNIE